MFFGSERERVNINMFQPNAEDSLWWNIQRVFFAIMIK